MVQTPPSQPDADGATSATFAAIVPDPEKTGALKPKIVDAISTVYDPEIPVNIWELGLIYDIAVDASGVAGVLMTLTAPGCPAAQSLPVEVEQKVKAVPGVTDATVEVVWDPAWTKDRMSEAARLQLGLW
jgi:FeS assembly SUF system protein